MQHVVGGYMNIYLVIFITLIAALIASFSQLTYKKGIKSKLNGIGDMLLLLKNRLIIMGVLGYLASLVVYLYALSNAPLSIVYPTFASTFIFITIISAVYLHEPMSAGRVAGVAFIFLGILFIAATL
jgi:drug/metabolite transporter (DMT)-like permease